jgi:hypothetical protein
MDTKTVAAPPMAMHSVGEAAALAGISKRYMELRIAEGTGPDVTRIGRRVLVRDDRLRAWIDQQTEETIVNAHDEREIAALTVLRAVEHRMQGDGEAMVKSLRGNGRQVSVRLCEAVEIIAHMLKLSDRPEQALAALLQSVSPTD